MSRYKITHSLLYSWAWATDPEATPERWNEFLNDLKRIPSQDSQAKQDGRLFEDEVTRLAQGGKPNPDFQWAEQAAEFASVVKGAQPQVRMQAGIQVCGMDFMLVGVADYIKAGTIYDTKKVQRYEYGKYVASSQHPAYFRLCPEARRFVYLITDGRQTYRETYYPQETMPIETFVIALMQFLTDKPELMKIYKQKWRID